jgi:hypothetical protein
MKIKKPAGAKLSHSQKIGNHKKYSTKYFIVDTIIIAPNAIYSSTRGTYL